MIADRIGVPAPKMSTGSTEPREIFDLVDDAFGLRLQAEQALTKPEMAQRIVEAAGHAWLADCESRGGTVTLRGLVAVLEAVDFLLGEEGSGPY